MVDQKKLRTSLRLTVVISVWCSEVGNQLREVRIDIHNGDTHFVIMENTNRKRKNTMYLDEAEIRKTSKIEASKPLILIRAE